MKDVVALVAALVPLGVAVVQYQARVEAEEVTQDILRAVNASLENYDPCD